MISKRCLSKLLLLAALVTFGNCASALPVPKSNLRYFYEVDSWLARGAQPTKAGFVELKNRGFRTVINFRHEPKWIEWEREVVEGLRMNYVSLPWSITKDAPGDLLDRFFEVLDNPLNRPVFYHCKHGRDRTGAITVITLMHYKKLSEGEARDRAFRDVSPNLRYRMYVNRRIRDFVRSFEWESAKS
ncbi:MAG: tyrosine-protein phosphatase [Candidatus Omnitrophica bacterium]|nr:tyrosine-protein phosphatase [Candidatus Omnitrophota bacterium]